MAKMAGSSPAKKLFEESAVKTLIEIQQLNVSIWDITPHDFHRVLKYYPDIIPSQVLDSDAQRFNGIPDNLRNQLSGVPKGLDSNQLRTLSYWT